MWVYMFVHNDCVFSQYLTLYNNVQYFLLSQIYPNTGSNSVFEIFFMPAFYPSSVSLNHFSVHLNCYAHDK